LTPLELVESEVPIPLRVNFGVLVRMLAAGINPIDAKIRSGGGVATAIDAYPTALGRGFSGVVIESPFEKLRRLRGSVLAQRDAGAGGAGHFAVQLARYFGAHVIATGATSNADCSAGSARARSSTTRRRGSRRASTRSTR